MNPQEKKTRLSESKADFIVFMTDYMWEEIIKKTKQSLPLTLWGWDKGLQQD